MRSLDLFTTLTLFLHYITDFPPAGCIGPEDHCISVHIEMGEGVQVPTGHRHRQPRQVHGLRRVSRTMLLLAAPLIYCCSTMNERLAGKEVCLEC